MDLRASTGRSVCIDIRHTLQLPWCTFKVVLEHLWLLKALAKIQPKGNWVNTVSVEHFTPAQIQVYPNGQLGRCEGAILKRAKTSKCLWSNFQTPLFTEWFNFSLNYFAVSDIKPIILDQFSGEKEFQIIANSFFFYGWGHPMGSILTFYKLVLRFLRPPK